jgi:hypothetical protein
MKQAQRTSSSCIKFNINKIDKDGLKGSFKFPVEGITVKGEFGLYANVHKFPLYRRLEILSHSSIVQINRKSIVCMKKQIKKN